MLDEKLEFLEFFKSCKEIGTLKKQKETGKNTTYITKLKARSFILKKASN